MAAQKFRVRFAESAWLDLTEIADYWTQHGDPARGAQYAHDLPIEAVSLLSDPTVALSGRHLRRTAYPQVQEHTVFKRSYRILYLVEETENLVRVLRFWHGHRDEPFQR
ncbi:MAG: plasmid stabilization system protein ParE [Limisphaerales bacterium]|jgi:plasmid stabilization system protein ParE